MLNLGFLFWFHWCSWCCSLSKNNHKVWSFLFYFLVWYFYSWVICHPFDLCRRTSLWFFETLLLLKKIMLCYFSMEMHANIGEQSHYGLLLDSFVLFVMDMFFAFMLMFSFLCLLFLQWICFIVWLMFLIPFIFLMLMLIRINSWIYEIIKF